MSSKLNEYAYEGSAVNTFTVSATSGTALSENVRRRSAVLVNTGSADVFLAIGRPAEAGKGIYLKANGGGYEINSTNLTHAAVNAITASGTSALSLHEGY